MRTRIIIETNSGDITTLIAYLLEHGFDFNVRTLREERAPLPLLREDERTDEPPKKRHLQRKTADGRTAAEVVEQKVRSMPSGRKFHAKEIETLSQLVGFAPLTLRRETQRLVREGKLEKIGKWEFRVPLRLPPLPSLQGVSVHE